MAYGSVFIPTTEEPYYDWIIIEYPTTYYRGASKTRVESEIVHREYRKNYNPNAKILEISRLTWGTGCLFSTKCIKLRIETKPYKFKKFVNIEAIYHGSKCFEYGGPYEDLLNDRCTAYRARTDSRLKASGKLINFHYKDRTYPACPAESAFFDWLYISALQGESNICDIAEQLLEYDAFTDQDFNSDTQLCIVCPARVAAMYVGMTRAGVLKKPVDYQTLAMLDCMMLCADYGVVDGMAIAPKPEQVKVVLDHPPIKVEIGEILIHTRYGEGKVIDVTEQGFKIDFKSVGEKSFFNPGAFESGFLHKI